MLQTVNTVTNTHFSSHEYALMISGSQHVA